LNCGYYKGVQFIDVLKKLNKRERKTKENEMKVKTPEGKGTGEKKSLNWENLSKK